MARDAVFRSWQNDRAKHYRRINNIRRHAGHRGQRAGHGVSATWATPAAPAWASPAIRRLATKEFYGEFLMNAQGEDVVSGVRTPVPISRTREDHARGVQPAARNHHAAGKALQGHAGFRVHHPGWQALHAADAQRQAYGTGGGAGRDADGGRRPDHKGRSDLPRRAQPAL